MLEKPARGMESKSRRVRYRLRMSEHILASEYKQYMEAKLQANHVLDTGKYINDPYCRNQVLHLNLSSINLTTMNSRRDFLKTLAAPVAAIPFMNFTVADEEVYQGPVLRVAIMGLGGYGTIVAEAMQNCKKAKLTGVISGTP